MKIIVGKHIGFCRGVENAICIAKSVVGGCNTLGKLIHNEQVLEDLRKLGIVAIEDISCSDGKKLIIRSHGVAKKVYEDMERLQVDYIDATCVFVKKIHKIVEEYHNLGYQIIIIGDENHPEVIGINGWCDNSAIIIKNADDMHVNYTEKMCVVSQTTFDKKTYEKIIKNLEKHAKTLVKHNTICYTTTARQTQAYELSKICDAMLVIGSTNSSNTKKLFDICKANCASTYFIQTVSDLKSVSVAKNNFKLGVIAGASTPHELIEEVLTLMSESQDNTKIEKITNEESFAAMFENSASAKSLSLKAGSVVKECKVISANEDGISINFGGKKDGFIDKSEVELDGVDYNPANYSEGNIIAAMVVANDGKTKKSDCIAFSKKAVDKRFKEHKDSEEMLKGNEFKATIDAVVKGGLSAKIGPFSIFVPASQIRVGYVTDADLQKYVGKTLRLRVIKGKKDSADGEVEIKRNKTVIASQRVILEEEKAVKEESLWACLEVGTVVTGKVKRFAEFGAFVSVNGFDCLAHISDLSHYKINHPSEILEINKPYEFVILKADRENQKVSLGYKQLQKKPYEVALEKYPVGSVITGTVRSVFAYGAFVLIERDVDGLIPVSEIAHSFTKDATNVYKVGDEVTAQIIKFDGNKITLSAKALIPQDQVEEVREVEVSEEAYQESKEKRAVKNAKKFEKPTGAPRKKSVKKNDEEEFSSWTSEKSSATFGDLFKGLNLNLEDKE